MNMVIIALSVAMFLIGAMMFIGPEGILPLSHGKWAL